MSASFRQFQTLTAGKLNLALREVGAAAGEAAAAPYATAAAASATAAAASETAAEADRVAAEAAVTAALGPILLTSVGGTSTAYTATASHAPTTGRSYWFIPHTTSGAPTITLSINSGTARSIRQSDGTQPVDGMLRSGRLYVLVYQSNNTFRAIDVADLLYVFTGIQAIRTGTFNIDHFQGGDVEARTRIQSTSDGEVLIRAAGDGTNAADVKFGVLSDGSVRIYDGLRIDGVATLGTTARLLSDDYPSLTYPNIRRHVGAPSRMNGRTAPQRISVPANGYYQVGGLDQHRDIVVGNGAWVDFTHMPKGSTVNLIPSGSAVFHLYTGEGEWDGDGSTAASLTAHSWVNTGGKILTTSAGAWVRVRRGGSSTFLAIADSGSVSAGTPTMPSHDAVVGFGPQSWGVDLRQNSAAGWAPRMEALGLGTKFYSPDTANVGASSILYSSTNATLFHWDQRTDVPGQRLTDIIEAIKADRTARTTLMGSTAPAMSAFVWYCGLNEMEAFGASGSFPDNNPDTLIDGWIKAAQHMHSELGYDLVHIVVPLTSQKLGTFSEEKWHGIRMAQARLVAAGAAASPAVTFVLAPEVYGDPRSGDEEAESGERHYDYPVHAVQAERICDAWANAVHAQSNWLGPVVTGVATADSGAGLEWDVTIDYGTGNSFNQAKRPERFFRLLPVGTGSKDTDDFATPLNIVATRWVAGSGTTIKLRCTLDAAYLAGTPRPCVLYGSAEATDEISSVIYALHPTTSKRYYLRTYLSGG